MVPWVFDSGMGFERYVDYVLDVPMYFVYRDGKYIDAAGLSFRDFLKGELSVLPGEKPTLDGMAYLRLKAPEELAAYEWLNRNIRGIPVVLEAHGDPASEAALAR